MTSTYIVELIIPWVLDVATHLNMFKISSNVSRVLLNIILIKVDNFEKHARVDASVRCFHFQEMKSSILVQNMARPLE